MTPRAGAHKSASVRNNPDSPRPVSSISLPARRAKHVLREGRPSVLLLAAAGRPTALIVSPGAAGHLIPPPPPRFRPLELCPPLRRLRFSAKRDAPVQHSAH